MPNLAATFTINIMSRSKRPGASNRTARVYEFVAARVLPDRWPELRLVATHDWDTHGAISAGLMAAYIDRSPARPTIRSTIALTCFATTMGDVVTQILQEDGR